MEPLVKVIVSPLEYGSAPFWYYKKELLYFVDVFKSVIHQYDPQNNRHTCAKVGDKPVGFIIPIEDFQDKFMIGYGSDLAAVTWDGESNQISKLVIVERIEMEAGNRISDGKVSPGGVLFVGTSGPGHLTLGNLKLNQAVLYTFKDCEMKKLLSNVSVSAGMAWNGNENIFYYIDSPEYRIEKYCYDRNQSELEQGCVMYELQDDNLSGCPSGITIDMNEHIWLSCFGGGQVLRIDSRTGKAITKIEIPHCPQITSVTFGGRNLDILYVTSADYNLKTKCRNAGSVFQVSGLGTRGQLSLPLQLIKNN